MTYYSLWDANVDAAVAQATVNPWGEGSSTAQYNAAVSAQGGGRWRRGRGDAPVPSLVEMRRFPDDTRSPTPAARGDSDSAPPTSTPPPRPTATATTSGRVRDIERNLDALGPRFAALDAAAAAFHSSTFCPSPSNAPRSKPFPTVAVKSRPTVCAHQAYLFTDLLATHVFSFLTPGANLEKQRTTVHIVAAVARTAPTQIAPVLPEIVPGVLKAVQRDDDELRGGVCRRSRPRSCGARRRSRRCQYIKYDPNFAGDDDEDEEMVDADDDDEEDVELDEYMMKTRRSATKLLAAIVGTRPELLSSIYKDISPVFNSRFGDREETEGPYSLLEGQVPALSKALLNQLKSTKTPPATLQAGFALLHALLDVLPGSLASQVTFITATSQSILAQPPSTSTSALHLACLSFLVLFFASHSPPTFTPSLSTLTSALLRSLGERHPRVASETFRVFSALLNALKPIKASGEWPEAVYEQAVPRLTQRARYGCGGARVGGDVHRGPVGARDTASGRRSGPRGAESDGAVEVVTRVARDVAGALGDAWVNGAAKMEVFQGLDVLFARRQSSCHGSPTPTLDEAKQRLPDLRCHVDKGKKRVLAALVKREDAENELAERLRAYDELIACRRPE
ncbi:hypothetical protein B0H11DRAFT_2313761 [Mycena galericulata]|nr:hypothetical protein B0H11DRAFT_2313761 [Mycena galericulata]